MLPDPVNSAFKEAQNIVTSKVLQINPVYSAFQEAQNRVASTVSQIVEGGVIESQQEITKWGFIIISLIAVLGSAVSIALIMDIFLVLSSLVLAENFGRNQAARKIIFGYKRIFRNATFLGNSSNP
jgi:hypothetical protein